ncbi:MAG: LPP20 family lipoprotein [Campylobacterales bacterium]|nr:LPP20 family lipoprotein [Campylobacterales bacterium]
MKKTVLLIVSLLTQLSADAPAWFGTLSSSAGYEIIGYGEGVSLDEAKANAKSDIAKTIRSHIDSTFTTQTSVNNATLEHNASHSVRETSNLTLSDVVMLQRDQKNGHFYVALQYDNRPLFIKLARLGGQALCGEPNPYLAQTSILKNLSTELNCTTSVEITRDQNGWYLGRGEYRVVLNESDFENLMIEASNGSLRLSATPSRVNVDEAYTLSLDALPFSGYLSLFDVYDDGRVVVMEKNIDLTRQLKKKLLYPNDIRHEDQLVGGLNVPLKDALDLCVAVVSNKPLELSKFTPMGETTEKGERAYAMDRLLSLMKNNPFATTVVTTRAVKVSRKY